MPIYLDIPVGSYHFDRAIVEERRLNENNRGIGLTWKIDNRQTMLGYYKNSLSRNSYYASYGVIRNAGNFSYGIIGGAATGYWSSIVPLVAVTASYDVDRCGVGVVITPTTKALGSVNYGFIGMQFRLKIK